jgi:hypothetical protein
MVLLLLPGIRFLTDRLHYTPRGPRGIASSRALTSAPILPRLAACSSVKREPEQKNLAALPAFLTPLELARRAVWLVDADHLAAAAAGPPVPFVSDESPYAELPDVLQILAHAHAILSSVPPVQLAQSGARKTVAFKAVINLGAAHLLTVLNSARQDGFHFEAIITPAPGAAVLVPRKRVAKATVHSAGSDPGCANGSGAFRSWWCHAGSCHIARR